MTSLGFLRLTIFCVLFGLFVPPDLLIASQKPQHQPQPPPSLFRTVDLEDGSDLNKILGEEADRSKLVTINLGALRGFQHRTHPVSVEFFDGKTSTLTLQNADTKPAFVYLTGVMEGDINGRFSITYQSAPKRNRNSVVRISTMSAQFNASNGDVFYVNALEDNLHTFRQSLRSSTLLDSGEPFDDDLPTKPKKPEINNGAGKPGEKDIGRMNDAAAGQLEESKKDGHSVSSSTIDIAVFYTKLCKDNNGGEAGVTTLANHCVNNLNQALIDSGSSRRFCLVYAGPVDPAYDETPYNLSKSAITDPPGILEHFRYPAPADDKINGVHSIRKSNLADVAALLVYKPGRSGTAYRMKNDTNSAAAFAPKAFSVCNAESANLWFTFQHEIGHHFGCCDRGAVNKRIYPYGYGHIYNVGGQTRGTLMEVSSNRQLRYSNPDQTDGGQATGVVDAKDCERVIEQTAPILIDLSTKL